jgi:hypothetical protein
MTEYSILAAKAYWQLPLADSHDEYAQRRSVSSAMEPSATLSVPQRDLPNSGACMLKFIGGTVGIIFIIGLIVVIGILKLIF